MGKKATEISNPKRRSFMTAVAGAAFAADSTAQPAGAYRIDCQSHLYVPELLKEMEGRQGSPRVYRQGSDLYVVVNQWVRRVLPKHLGVGIDLARVPVLPVFKWLAEEGGVAELELLRTFNCGIGMIAVVRQDAVDAVSEVFAAGGETVTLLGEVIAAAGEHRVVYNGHLDLSR